jgi:hypothetical protein
LSWSSGIGCRSRPDREGDLARGWPRHRPPPPPQVTSAGGPRFAISNEPSRPTGVRSGRSVRFSPGGFATRRATRHRDHTNVHQGRRAVLRHTGWSLEPVGERTSCGAIATQGTVWTVWQAVSAIVPDGTARNRFIQ